MNLIKITCLVILLACLASSTAFASRLQANSTDFAAIDEYIEAQMKELRIPGLALGIVQGGPLLVTLARTIEVTFFRCGVS